MSHEEAVLGQTIEQLERMNSALAHLRTEVLPKNPRMFAVMAEGPLEEIRRLHAEILQQTEALAAMPVAA